MYSAGSSPTTILFSYGGRWHLAESCSNHSLIYFMRSISRIYITIQKYIGSMTLWCRVEVTLVQLRAQTGSCVGLWKTFLYTVFIYTVVIRNTVIIRWIFLWHFELVTPMKLTCCFFRLPVFYTGICRTNRWTHIWQKLADFVWDRCRDILAW